VTSSKIISRIALLWNDRKSPYDQFLLLDGSDDLQGMKEQVLTKMDDTTRNMVVSMDRFVRPRSMGASVPCTNPPQ
jgi:hypothetical protein